MELPIPSQIALVEYTLAPWYLRLRWWCATRFWCWCQSFEALGVESPQQANPLWRVW